MIITKGTRDAMDIFLIGIGSILALAIALAMM